MGKSEVFNITAIFGDEDTYGTLNASANGVKIPIISSTIAISQNKTDTNEFDGLYVNALSIAGNYSTSGTITLRMRPKSYGYFLGWFLGAPSTTGTGPYTHTFTANSSTVKSFQMEIGRTDADSGYEFELHKGLVITGIDTPVDIEGQLEVTINVSGGKQPAWSATSAFSGTVTDLTSEAEVLNNIDGTISAGTTFTASSVSFNMARATEMFYGIGDSGESSDYYRSKYTATGDATFIFANAAVMTKALAQTADNIAVGASDGTYSCTYTAATIEWDAGNQKPDSNTVQQLATMNYRAYGTLVVALVNAQASY